MAITYVHEQSTNHTSLEKGRPRCKVIHRISQEALEPIPGLIGCTGVTGRWRLLSRTQNAVRRLVYILVWLFNLPLATAQLASYMANIG